MSSNQPDPKNRRAIVLLVDDEADLRDILKDELEYHGFGVLDAVNGRRAFELAQANRGGFDAILTDIRMPGGSGIELLDNVVSAGLGVPVFLLSAFSDLTDADARARGAAGLFSKPCDFDEVIGAIRRELAGRGVRLPEPRPLAGKST